MGFANAVEPILYIQADSLSHQWKRTHEKYYKQFLFGRDTLPTGKVIYNQKNAGNMNVSPVISPDGNKMNFLSEKNVLSMDL